MPGIKAIQTGRTASTAAASPAVKRGADADPIPDPGQTGNHVDGGLAALILEESGGGPAAAESDTDDATESRAKGDRPKARGADPASGESDDTEGDDESSEDADDDQEGAQDQDQTDQTDGTDQDEAGTDEAEGEEPAAEGEPETDDTPEWARKRFREYSRKLENRDREIEDLRARLNPASTETTRPREPQPIERELLLADTPEQVTAIRQRYEDLEDWATTHRDGIEADPENPESRAFTREQVGATLLTARKALRAIPQRLEQLSKVREYNTRAAELFPGFRERDSDESRALEYILRTVPEIKRLPNYKVILGDALAHERLRAKEAKTKANQNRHGQVLPGKPAAANVRRVPPALPGGPTRAPSQERSREERLGKVRQRAYKSGSEADIADLVEAGLSR